MLTRIVTWAVRRRRMVLTCAVLFFVIAAAIGSTAASNLSSSGGFVDPHAPSLRATETLQSLDSDPPGLLIEVRPLSGPVSSPAGAAAGGKFTADVLTRVHALGGRSVDVFSYWNTGLTVLRSKDRAQGLILVRLSPDPDLSLKQAAAIQDGLSAVARADGVTVQVGGEAVVIKDLADTVKQDLVRSDSIAIPLTGLLLVLIFGSAVAAALPLVVGLLAVVGSLAVLRLLVIVTPVSVYATNLAAALGLGLGIDYGLFIVTRYREEIAAGRTPEQAAIASVRTAGRTVLFSAFTVAAALAATLVFPLFYLRSYGYAGVSATLVAALAAVVVLPALLVAWSRWLSRLDLRKPVRRVLRLGPPPPAGLAPPDGGIWRKIALTVMRRPLLLGGSVVVVLVLVGLPFFSVRFGIPDDRSLPPSSPTYHAMLSIEKNFGQSTTDSISIVSDSPQPSSTKVADYQRRLSLLPHVASTNGPAGTWEGGRQTAKSSPIFEAEFLPWVGSYINVTPTVPSVSPAGVTLVKEIRAMPSPYPITLVGGNSADLIDTESGIGGSLPLAGGIMAAVTLIVLFLFTGSVVMPIKAILMTLLSLTATFGVMVWGFQEGHLAGILHFNVTGSLDTTIPILMFCVVFGLSMDYEVFLLSRIKEEYDRTGDNIHAVATGLEKTGRVVSSAAVILAVVFAAFWTSHVQFIQLLGVGSFVAVVVDATLVRGVLVPSFMRLAGAGNWWAPKPLSKLWDLVGLKEAAAELPPGLLTVSPATGPQPPRVLAPPRITPVRLTPQRIIPTRVVPAPVLVPAGADPERYLDLTDDSPRWSRSPITATFVPHVYTRPAWMRSTGPVPPTPADTGVDLTSSGVGESVPAPRQGQEVIVLDPAGLPRSP